MFTDIFSNFNIFINWFGDAPFPVRSYQRTGIPYHCVTSLNFRRSPQSFGIPQADLVCCCTVQMSVCSLQGRQLVSGACKDWEVPCPVVIQSCKVQSLQWRAPGLGWFHTHPG